MFFRKLCRNTVFPVDQNNENRREEENHLRTAGHSQIIPRRFQTLQIQQRNPPRNTITTFNTRSLNSQRELLDVDNNNNNNNRNHINSLPPYSSNNNGGDCNPIPLTPPPSYTPRCQNLEVAVVQEQEIIIPQQQHQQEQQNQPIELVVAVANRYEIDDTSSSSSEESESDGRYRRGIHSAGRLRGNHCPDLLHSCSLILPSQQQQQHFSNQLTEETPFHRQPFASASAPASSDYAEIDEISTQFSQIDTNNNNIESLTKIAITTNATESSVFQNQGECQENSLKTLNYKADYNQAMGQNLSLRRPKLSMTWVLREQQQQQSNTNSNSTNSNETSSSDQQQQHKKKYKTKNNKDEKFFNEKYVSSHNLQEYQDKREPCKDLLFVCTPQKQPISQENFKCTEIIRRRRNEIHHNNNCEKLPPSGTTMMITRPTMKTFKVSESVFEKLDHESVVNDAKSLKGTYSEPSLIAASEGNHRRHRHRKRRDRNRMQKFGYEIRNVDEFLSKCSLSSPGNIPVVLSSSSTLYQTRPGGYQIEIPLPLGMVVNAVFKNQNWLYVQTPHAEEGYVGYSSCLPLGILPPAARRSSSTATAGATTSTKPVRCWETNSDVFTKPCGNMTDSEKEIRLRGGTRSDGARTPRLRKTSNSSTTAYKSYGERHVDRLYLRAASQPKLTEKSYAQLKTTNKMRLQQHAESLSRLTNDEYVVLQKQQHRPKIIPNPCANIQNNCKARNLLRQTLLAITNDYSADSVNVKKGEIVTLIECRESKDRRQWFYVKTREGREGYIPAECAGHGFL